MVQLPMRQVAAAAVTLSRGRLSRYAGSSGSSTDRFERELAAHVGVQHALAVNSGTSALVCALVALGIGPGDEVLVPAYTWVSDAAAVVCVGAVPVLVDVDESLTVDVDDAERRVTSRTRAVIAVHMSNLVCDMERLLSMAEGKGLHVIEDACQAIGVTYRGRQAGGLAHIGVFSFNQHKNLRSGEGGAVLTDDVRLHTRATMFHDVGSYTRAAARGSYPEPVFVGMNLRMPELSSAVLRPQLRGLDAQMRRRRQRRAMWLEELAGRTDVRPSPHHDPQAAVGLTVLFDDPEDAQQFAEAPGVTRLLDTGRHVHTNWTPILEQRTHDPRVDPWRGREAAPQTCTRTLDILSRSCGIALDPDVPLTALRLRARRLARTGAV